MKLFISMLSLVFTVNVFALSTVSTGGTSISTVVLQDKKVQATLVLNDAQEMIDSGRVSIFLSEKLIQTQSKLEGVSESEALDILIESAHSILSE